MHKAPRSTQNPPKRPLHHNLRYRIGPTCSIAEETHSSKGCFTEDSRRSVAPGPPSAIASKTDFAKCSQHCLPTAALIAMLYAMSQAWQYGVWPGVTNANLTQGSNIFQRLLKSEDTCTGAQPKKIKTSALGGGPPSFLQPTPTLPPSTLQWTSASPWPCMSSFLGCALGALPPSFLAEHWTGSHRSYNAECNLPLATVDEGHLGFHFFIFLHFFMFFIFLFF